MAQGVLYILYISVKMAAPWWFVDFTKLLFALSSLAQPLKRVRSISEHFFVILNQRKAWAGRFREETAGKNRSDDKMAAPEASGRPVIRNCLYYHFSLYQTNESCSEVFQEG